MERASRVVSVSPAAEPPVSAGRLSDRTGEMVLRSATCSDIALPRLQAILDSRQQGCRLERLRQARDRAQFGRHGLKIRLGAGVRDSGRPEITTMGTVGRSR